MKGRVTELANGSDDQASPVRWTSEQSVVSLLTRGASLRLRRSNFRDIWLVALAEAGLSGVHLHDLRHTGNTMAAATGASLRELMDRMGTLALAPR